MKQVVKIEMDVERWTMVLGDLAGIMEEGRKTLLANAALGLVGRATLVMIGSEIEALCTTVVRRLAVQQLGGKPKGSSIPVGLTLAHCAMLSILSESAPLLQMSEATLRLMRTAVDAVMRK